MRIGVLEKGQSAIDRPIFHLKKSVAEDLVKRGHAEWVEPGRLIRRLIGPLRPPKQLGFAKVNWPR
jgi:hypothetical protein